jgi:Flp pilus assembly secretin CpaC
MVIRVLLLFIAAIAATPAAAQTHFVAGDEVAHFVPLELGKSIVIDLPEPVADVLVTQPKTANVVMRTSTRAFVIAVAAGDTNIFFFNARKQRIEAFDISVRSTPVEAAPPLEPKQVITVVRGAEITSLSCTRTSRINEGARCYEPEKSSRSIWSFF